MSSHRGRTYMGPINMINEAAKAKGHTMKIRVEIDGLPEKYERTIRFVMPTEIMVICTPGTERERSDAAGVEADTVLAAMGITGLPTPHLPVEHQNGPVPMPGHATPHVPLQEELPLPVPGQPTPHLPIEHQGERRTTPGCPDTDAMPDLSGPVTEAAKALPASLSILGAPMPTELPGPLHNYEAAPEPRSREVGSSAAASSQPSRSRGRPLPAAQNLGETSGKCTMEPPALPARRRDRDHCDMAQQTEQSHLMSRRAKTNQLVQVVGKRPSEFPEPPATAPRLELHPPAPADPVVSLLDSPPPRESPADDRALPQPQPAGSSGSGNNADFLPKSSGRVLQDTRELVDFMGGIRRGASLCLAPTIPADVVVDDRANPQPSIACMLAALAPADSKYCPDLDSNRGNGDHDDFPDTMPA